MTQHSTINANDRGGTRGTIIAALTATMGITNAASAFTLLNFPSPTQIADDNVLRWPDAPTAGGSFVLLYQIDDEFLEDTGLPRDDIEAAVEAALETWSDATRGVLRFERSPWDTVLNEGNSPPSQFVGPPVEDWLDDFLACNGDPACQAALPSPGWGAHIEFFSRPAGWSNDMGGTTWQLTQCNLGFLAYFRDGQTAIRSADIILNEKWNWTTDPSAAADPPQLNCSTNFPIDLQTVLLHEIGHALGLDHPDQAIDSGSLNLNPRTFEPLPTGSDSPYEVMFSNYTGTKRTLTDDERGGLAFLYPPRPGDLDADDAASFGDYNLAISLYSLPAPVEPYALSALDIIERDGEVTGDEIILLNNWVLGTVPYPDSTPRYHLLGGPTTEITVALEPDPTDAGLGGIAIVDVRITNPDDRQLVGWDISLAFDPNVFSNPVLLDGELLPNGFFIPLSTPAQGLVRFGKLNGAAPMPALLEGVAASIAFDVDIQAALASPAVSITHDDVMLFVNDPLPHTFARNPAYPDEILTLQPADFAVSDFDVDDSNTVQPDDLYAFFADPTHDVDRDGDRDNADRLAIEDAIRQSEPADITTNR